MAGFCAAHRRRLQPHAWLVLCLLVAGPISPVWATTTATATQQQIVELAGVPLEVEYVADPERRRQGLMGRTDLPSGTGMLFDFPEGTQPSIWMRNMKISLDLLYIDARGDIVQIFRDVPPCRSMPCEIYHASKPLRFVLEVPAGTATELGLLPGQQIGLGALKDRPAPRQ